MNGLTLDAGALIAVERHIERIRALLRRAQDDGLPVHIPAGALAQAWRNHPRRHALHILLSRDDVDVVPLDLSAALAAGALCAGSATRNVVDASVVVCAEDCGDAVITSDPGDIAALGPDLRIFTI